MWPLRCHMSSVVELDWNNSAVFLFYTLFSLLLLLSLPSTQLLGYEEKHQNHRSVENEPTGAHGPSGAAHHWTFSMWLPLFPHLSSSPPSLLGKLEIGVKVYTVPHAARWHCLPVYLQSHGRKIKKKREGDIEEREKKKHRNEERGGWFGMRGTWRPDNHLFCSPPPARCLLNHHLLQREREKEGCSVMQEGGSKRVWKKRVKRKNRSR